MKSLLIFLIDNFVTNVFETAQKFKLVVFFKEIQILSQDFSHFSQN